MPALWLASKGALFELHEANVPKSGPIAALSSDPAPSSSAAPSSDGRTDEENGIVTATSISGILIPAALQVKDNGAAKGLCTALVTSAGSMYGVVAAQEFGKNVYGNDSTNSQFEQGVIPGSFFGGLLGNGIGQALSRSICKHLVPDFENYLKGLPEDAVGKAAKVLDRGLEQVLATHLMDLGVTASRAIQFSAQLTETIRIADQFTPEDAFKYLEQQMVTTTAEIAKGVKGAKGFGAKPALDQMVQLTTNTGLAFGLSVPPFPLSPPATPPMVTITDHLSRFNDVAQSFPKARKVAVNLKKATDGLRDGIKKSWRTH
jgi:hypothetical protein